MYKYRDNREGNIHEETEECEESLCKINCDMRVNDRDGVEGSMNKCDSKDDGGFDSEKKLVNDGSDSDKNAGEVSEINEVAYDWKPPCCNKCCVFEHFTHQCGKNNADTRKEESMKNVGMEKRKEDIPKQSRCDEKSDNDGLNYVSIIVSSASIIVSTGRRFIIVSTVFTQCFNIVALELSKGANSLQAKGLDLFSPSDLGMARSTIKPVRWPSPLQAHQVLLTIREIKINNLNLELEKAVKERDELKDKIAKWEESTKNLDEILKSQLSARDKTGLGYSTQLNELSSNHETDSENSFSVFNGRSSDEDSIPANDRSSKTEGYKVVPPPITGNFLTPRAKISFVGLDEYAIRNKIIESQTSKLNNETNRVIIEDSHSDDEEEVSKVQTFRPETQKVKTRDDKSGQTTKKQGISFRKVKACFVCKSTDHLIKDYNFHDKKSQESNLKNVVNTGKREGKPVWDNTKRVNHQNFSKYPHLSKTFVPSGVLTRTGFISTARPVCTARPSINTARPVSTASPSISIARPVYASRPIYPRMDNVRPRGTCSPIKRSYYIKSAFRPKDLKQYVKIVRVKNMTIDGKRAVVNTDSGSFMLKKGNPEILLQDHAVVDSGFSSHMTGNKAYLSDYEDFKGGFNNSVLFTESECLILSPSFKILDESQVVLKAPRKDDVYNLDLKNIVPSGGITCLYANATADESKLWHRRLGHKGKQHKASCKAKLDRIIKKPLELLHMDLFGPVSIESINKKRYCLVVTDDFSRFSWVFFLATKDETSEILCNLIIGLEKQLNHNVKIIRCDNGTEFKNYVMNEFCAKKGIKREFSVARTPQQNGVAERKNRTLIEAARTMLADSLLPIPFWAEAVNTACYVLNRVLVTKPQNKTPYELLIGKSPSISFMRPFGCPLTILNTLDSLDKFDRKSDESYLLGYSTFSKDFRVYKKRTKRVEENLHINFLEDQPNVAGTDPNWMFDLDFLTNSMNYIPVSVENQVNVDAGTQDSYVAAPLPEDNTFGSAEDSMQLKELMDIVPKLVTRIETLETELQQTKTTYGKAVLTLVNRVKLLEKVLKRKTQKVVVSKSEGEEPEDQGRIIQDINDDPLVSLVRESMKMKEKSIDFVTPTKDSGDDQEEDISPTILEAAKTLLKVASQGVSKVRDIGGRLVARIINTGLDAEEEINIGIEEATYKTKEQIRQEEAGLEEAIKLQAQMDEEVANQIHLDKMIAKRMAEEEELSEQQKKRKAEVQEAAQNYTEEDWDTIRAKLEANAELTKSLQGESLNGEDFAKRMVEMINQKKKFYAEQKAKAKRSKPITQVYLNDFGTGYDHGCMLLKRDSPFEFEAYSDSDYEGASLDRKSIIGGCQFLGRRLISWQCKKQTIMTNSSTEAEYVVTANCYLLTKGFDITRFNFLVVSIGLLNLSQLRLKIKALKAQVKKLKKGVKPLITHHKAWMKTRLSRKTFLLTPYLIHPHPKGAVGAFDDLDNIVDDTLDYMEFEDAQDEGRTSSVVLEEKESANEEVSTEAPVSTDKQYEGTDKKNDGTDKQDGGTDSTKVSTDRQGEGTADQNEGKSVTQIAPTSTSTSTPTTPTPTIFSDDETIAQVLIIINDQKIKGKRGLREDESDTESEEITEAEKKFKQLANDEEVARKVQEEWEAEEEKKRLAEEEATKVALTNEYDFIQARINADKILVEELQKKEREKFTIEQRAKFLHDTVIAQRKFLAQQRSKAIENKSPIRNQLRNQMMTYLKHVGGKKHSELKTKTFEEIQVLYERLKRQDQNFVAIGSAEDERQIKELNKDPEKKILKKKVVNETPREEDTAKVPAEQEVTEQGTKKRKSGHVKMIARKRPRPQPDDDSDDEHRKCLRIVTFEGTIDSEIIETKSFIARLHKVSSPDGNYLVVYRVNGHFRAFNYLMEVLHIFDRQDLFHLYDLVMKQYSEITPEDIELILWGDLKIMMESSTEENDQGLLHQMLDFGLEVEEEKYASIQLFMDEVCYQLLKMIEKQAGIRK
ncbi:putative ribonuclease H-like domain-containing protein [Tanacetum coccineum]